MIGEVRYMMATALLTSMMMLACSAPRAGLTETELAGTMAVFQEREEINRTFQLTPGARVEVSSIRGSVEITNTDSSTAEVQIIRTAKNRADLDYHKIEVVQTANGLVVRGIQEPEDRRRRNVQVNHHVILKLPRRIELAVTSVSGSLRSGDVEGLANVSSISGSVNLGNVGGNLQANSISGHLEAGNIGGEAHVNSVSGDVRLGQVNGVLDVTSVSGSLRAALANLSPRGIQIKSVSGSIELAFKGEINADFNAEGVSGQVYLEVPNVNRDGDVKSSNVRARIGAGGTPITISSVSGNIRLVRS